MNGGFSAVLLAAGRSTRMKQDKALLPAPDGDVLWRWQRQVLARAGAEEIFLSARADQDWAANAGVFAGVLADSIADGGPLLGVVSALERASRPFVAVLAIDLPRMEPGWFARLARSCAPGVGAVGRFGNFFEPLAAIYPREILPLARAAIGGEKFSLQALLGDAVARGLMRAHEITSAEASWFENWNDPLQPGPGARR